METTSLRYARLVEQHGLSSIHLEVIRQIGRRKQVLELGCSTGFVGRILATEADCQVDGVELDPEAATIAQPYYGAIYVGSLDDRSVLERVSGPYDVIIATEVLEHLSRPEAVLASCRRLLRPDGFILVSLPNVAHWVTRWRLLRGHWAYEETGLLDHTHLRFYTYWSARELLASSGYEVIEHLPMQVYLPLDWRVTRLAEVVGCRRVWARIRHHAAAWLPNLFAMNTLVKGCPVPRSLWPSP